MAIIKSINQNYQNLDNDDFYTPDQYRKEISSMREERFDDWTEFGLTLKIRHINPPENPDQDFFNKEIKDIWLSLDEKENNKSHVLIVQSGFDWKTIQEQIYVETFVDGKNKVTNWLYLYDIESSEIVRVFSNKKYNLLQRIVGNPYLKAKRNYKNGDAISQELTAIYFPQKLDRDQEILLKQAKIKTEELENWTHRLQQAKMMDENEAILDIVEGRLRRNHLSVNSNFNKRGKIILTSKRLVFARRSFSLFGFGIAALIPILAFVRPANKVILIGRTLTQYLKVPFQIAKPVFRSFAPVFGALIVSINFINFDAIKLSLEGFFLKFPSLDFLLPAINFTIQSPQVVLPSLGGFYALFRLGVFKILFRRYRLIYLPMDQLNFAIRDKNSIIGRWKVKGHQLVRAQEGIEFNFRIKSHGEESSEIVATRFFVNMMNAANDYPKEVETHELA